MTIGDVNEQEYCFWLVMLMDRGYQYGDVNEKVYFSDVINVGKDADIAQIVFAHLLVNTPSLCLTLTGIAVATIARRRCRFHLSIGDYFKEVSYFSNAVRLLVIP
jgi:hypothetical protein